MAVLLGEQGLEGRVEFRALGSAGHTHTAAVTARVWDARPDAGEGEWDEQAEVDYESVSGDVAVWGQEAVSQRGADMGDHRPVAGGRCDRPRHRWRNHGRLFHESLDISDQDIARINAELDEGRAMVGVLARDPEADAVADKLRELGGTPQTTGVAEVAAADEQRQRPEGTKGNAPSEPTPTGEPVLPRPARCQ
ncbi:hypothetical protein [Streptomyces sp. NPDC090445]|uniref:hypothetical protein n=1 Tax=Streptomyces sp. NPDC090445 TaxID=3365963 RepID=UPI00381BA7D4